MSTPDSYAWGMKHLGESVSYPGHPLVLATMIMDRYHSFGHAIGRELGSDYNNALSDIFIPGAGCAVSSALDVLGLAIAGDLETAVDHAEQYWKGWEQQSPRNPERCLLGRVQAERVRPLFMERVQAWKDGVALPSEYRLPAPAPEVTS